MYSSNVYLHVSESAVVTFTSMEVGNYYFKGEKCGGCGGPYCTCLAVVTLDRGQHYVRFVRLPSDVLPVDDSRNTLLLPWFQIRASTLDPRTLTKLLAMPSLRFILLRPGSDIHKLKTNFASWLGGW